MGQVVTMTMGQSHVVDAKPVSDGTNKNLPLGVALITLAFLSAAVMSSFSKMATGVPPLLTLFLQYCISFLVFLPTVLRSGPSMLKTDRLGLHIFRSLAGA